MNLFLVQIYAITVMGEMLLQLLFVSCGVNDIHRWYLQFNGRVRGSCPVWNDDVDTRWAREKKAPLVVKVVYRYLPDKPRWIEGLRPASSACSVTAVPPPDMPQSAAYCRVYVPEMGIDRRNRSLQPLLVLLLCWGLLLPGESGVN